MREVQDIRIRLAQVAGPFHFGRTSPPLLVVSRPVHRTPCTRPAHSWWSRPRAPPGQPPRVRSAPGRRAASTHPASGRVPPAQRHDECGGPRRFGPRRRGPGAPAAYVTPRQERRNDAAHRRAAGPRSKKDAVWRRGPAAPAIFPKARAPARPHEYDAEVVVRAEEAAAEAEEQTHEKARHGRRAAEFAEEARTNSDDLAGVDLGSAARRAEAAKSCAKKARETESEEIE